MAWSRRALSGMSHIVTFGEVMGRLSPAGHRRFAQCLPGTLEVTFAGAEVNVAVSLALLGARASFVSALPDHAVADTVVAALRGLGVETRHLLRVETGRLGLYFYEPGINQRPGNVTYDREGASVAVTPPEAYDWDGIFQDATWFHFSGITPALSANAAAVTRRAVEEAAARGLPVSCDVNFRSKLWRWEPTLPPRELATRVMRELMPRVTVLFGGPGDAELLGIDGLGTPGEVARRLTAGFPGLTHVAMTARGEAAGNLTWGAALYETITDTLHQAPVRENRVEPYVIPRVVDRLGAGDAFAAGLIFALTTPELSIPQTAVGFAAAASCLAHSIDGDFNFSSRTEVESLMQEGRSIGVNR